jgi:hypothetical protein
MWTLPYVYTVLYLAGRVSEELLEVRTAGRENQLNRYMIHYTINIIHNTLYIIHYKLYIMCTWKLTFAGKVLKDIVHPLHQLNNIILN